MPVPDLLPHPEGGSFREVYRSPARVSADAGERAALTHIYFALEPGEVSRFHRVASDEVWHLYEGEGVRLHLWDGTDAAPESVELSRAGRTFCHVVPAGAWQAAEPLGEGVLVGCTVAPGFEFEDFELIAEGTDAAERLRAHVEFARFGPR